MSINWLKVYRHFFRTLIGFKTLDLSDATIRTEWMRIPDVPTLDGPELGVG